MSIKSPEVEAKVNKSKTPPFLVAFVAVYAVIALWVQQIIINSPTLFFFFQDASIYFDAGAKSLRAADPYQPFEIGSSFFYPPPTLLIFAPFSQLPRDFATVLWIGVALLAYLLTLFVLNSILKPTLNRLTFGCILITALLYLPLYETLFAGQVNNLVLLGLTLFILGHQNPKYRWLGDAGLAVAILIKVTPLMLVALPLFQRDWRRCVRICLSSLILAAVSVVFFGFNPWLDFIAVSPQVFAAYKFGWNESISSLFQFANADIVGKLFVLLLILLWLRVCWANQYKRGSLETGLVISFGIVVMTISSTLLWYHHLLFLAIPFAYLFYACYTDPKLRSLRLPSLLALAFIQLNRLAEHYFVAVPLFAVLGYLLLFVCLLTVLSRKKLLRRLKQA